MKNATVKMLTLAVLAATMFLTSAVAQEQRTQYKASIPFAFQMNGKTMPAGNYIVKLTDHFIQIRNAETNKGVGTVTVRTERSMTSGKDSLEFNVYGNQYFLSNVWFEDSANGRSVLVSKAEQEIARQASGGHVQLALKR